MGTSGSKQKREEEIFDYDQIGEDSWKVVYEKLEKSPVFSSKLQSNKSKVRKLKFLFFSQMTVFAKQISSVEELKKTYLNINWTDTVKLVEEQNKDEVETKKENKKETLSEKVEKINPIGKSKSEEEDYDNMHTLKKSVEEMTEMMKNS
jgi:hypothetical protein